MKRVPRIRFKGFSKRWKVKKLSNFFEKYQNTVYLDDNTEYKQISIRNNGTVEYRATQKGIKIGRKRQYKIDLDTYPITLTFTRQTVYDGGIGFVPLSLNGAIVTENMPLFALHDADKDYMKALFRTQGYRNAVTGKNLLTGSAQKALHEKQWLEGMITLPTLEEQEKIGAFFSMFDAKIKAQADLLEKLIQGKKGLLQAMFPAEGETEPRMRVKGFKGKWKRKKLKDLGEIITGSTPSTAVKEYYSDDGIPWVTPTDIKEPITRKTGRKLSLKGQKVARIVPAKTVLVTCIASIGKNTLLEEKGSFNQQINAIVPNVAEFDPYFLLTESSFWSQKMKESAAKSIMQIVNKSTFSEIETLVAPTLAEQQRIGALFSMFDHAISLHKLKLEQLKQVKKAFLQAMFPLLETEGKE